ncbi:MAG: SDR family NAD(P)-dependent oxidoreductase [Myxococcus sp.]|nr:SDR family NAD(P)-dependent oxidoreductase [Myxococcus sp.]
MGWTPAELPDLSGKTYVITGGNSGLGLEAAKLLTGKGARVVITARSADKANGALGEVRAAVPNADVDFVELDLADQKSVDAAAFALRQKCPRIDALINNAGVMQTPEKRTAEGFELQLATNHLGHFRLNAQLLDVLEASGGRVVPVSSIAHKFGKIALDDLQSTRGYDPTTAYSQSKLANLMYAFELQKRLAARGSKVTAIAAHPGYSATNLQTAGVGMEGGSALLKWMYKVTNAVMAQPAERGAWPLVLAAAAPSAKPGAYYGPTGLGQMRGAVGESFVADGARDEKVASQLWEKTEALVGSFFRA